MYAYVEPATGYAAAIRAYDRAVNTMAANVTRYDTDSRPPLVWVTIP